MVGEWMMDPIKIPWFRRPGSSWSLVYLVRGGSRPNLTEGSLSAAMGCFVQGYLIDRGWMKQRLDRGKSRDIQDSSTERSSERDFRDFWRSSTDTRGQQMPPNKCDMRLERITFVDNFFGSLLGALADLLKKNSFDPRFVLYGCVEGFADSESPPRFTCSICDAMSGSDSSPSGKYRSSSELQSIGNTIMQASGASFLTYFSLTGVLGTAEITRHTSVGRGFASPSSSVSPILSSDIKSASLMGFEELAWLRCCLEVDACTLGNPFRLSTGFDAIGEHTGDDHDRNIMVQFDGKPSGDLPQLGTIIINIFIPTGMSLTSQVSLDTAAKILSSTTLRKTCMGLRMYLLKDAVISPQAGTYECPLFVVGVAPVSHPTTLRKTCIGGLPVRRERRKRNFR
ncbi:hypothetical protein M5K25_007648 [Dendrobium thyrsiflorum]|uniref:Uncharacterized protein n=1 Tax=Dendrobium thyrsiflorum TaxID=117978 RepID=A0ABD0VM31_DENTH